MKPVVSILMSVYNDSDYLGEAVNSILNQTFADFEFIIIDDGSMDNSWELLNAIKDSRIILVRNDRNLGLPFSLNKGAGLARGDFIARMDADDISLPVRLEKQIAYLEKHPEVGVLGTSYENIGVDGRKISLCRNPCDHHEILWSNMAIAHPTVMMRTSLLKALGGYAQGMQVQHCEDYELWIRAASISRLANLQDMCLKYRIHVSSVSRKYQAIQYRNSIKVVRRSCSEFLGMDIGDSGAECLYKSAESLIQNSPQDVIIVIGLIEKLCYLYVERQHLAGPDRCKIFYYASNQLSKLAYINRIKYHLASIKAGLYAIKLTPQKLYFKRTLRVILGV